MANIKISELNELYGHQRAYDDYIPVVDSSASETKKISVGSLIPNNVNIIAVTDTAPVDYETGDKYYNTNENRIYTATSWGWENPQTPIGGILYVILADQKTYTYDGDNETLISVGGGGGGGIAVAPDEPTEDTKLYIESTDLDFQGLEIANEYTTRDNVAYSANYVNNLQPTILYEDNTGTTGNITLSSNANDYNYFLFKGVDNDDAISPIWAFGVLVGNILQLTNTSVVSSNYAMWERRYSVSNNTLTYTSMYYFTKTQNQIFSYNNFKVRQVIGYK